MTTKEAITFFKYYLQSNHKQRTIESYTILIDRFNAIHAERLLDDISPDEIFHFLEDLTKDLAKSTRRLRYAQLKAFYNFIIDRCSLNMRSPFKERRRYSPSVIRRQGPLSEDWEPN
jgi:site-specific recombinase XerD